MTTNPESIVWRIVSWKNISGGMTGFSHRQYLFDDLVTTESLPQYFKDLEGRGIEAMKVERMGTLNYVLQKNLHSEPRPGAKRISMERKNHKLEEYLEAR